MKPERSIAGERFSQSLGLCQRQHIWSRRNAGVDMPNGNRRGWPCGNKRDLTSPAEGPFTPRFCLNYGPTMAPQSWRCLAAVYRGDRYSYLFLPANLRCDYRISTMTGNLINRPCDRNTKNRLTEYIPDARNDQTCPRQSTGSNV